jgi:predicted glycoside hydrolase/deacetylase ChbG (UPF0249 family)
MVPAHFLIINADDLGISPEVNHGIFAAYEQGLVTDSSLLPKGPYSHEAIDMINENAGFPAGIHIDLDSLLGWESPGKEKFTRPELHRMMNNANFVQKVKQEIDEQIEAFLAAGLIPSHIDTHHHVHGFPQIFEPLLAAMDRYGIKALRFSKKGYFLLGREDILVAAETAQWMEDTLHEREIAYPQLLIDPLVPFFLQELPAGVAELMVHPSIGGDPWRQRDFEMLMDPLFMKAVRDAGIQLISFTEIDIS